MHMCNMEVQQLMTEPSVEIFLRCKYDQLYQDILSSEVILCTVLHGDHWCLVAILLKEKRMVYLDSIFHGVGSVKAFECLRNFIECAAKHQGKEHNREGWEFYVIPPSDIPQQHNSVDCGVFVFKWAQHISEGCVIDFDQSNRNDFHYSLILDIANNKLSCLALLPTVMSHLCYDVGAKHPSKM